MRIPIIVSNRIYIPIINEYEDVFYELKSKFSYSNPDYYRAKNLGKYTGNIDEKIKTYIEFDHPELGLCLGIQRGCMKRVKKILNKSNLIPSIMDRRVTLEPITHLNNNIELWPEQQTLAEIVFKKENCLIRSPTASGKTFTLLKLTEWILKKAGPVLIIVWEGNRKAGLFKQWLERIKDQFNIPLKEIGMIGDGVKKVRPITLAMLQTLKNTGYKYTNDFGGVICDEVHRFAANTFQETIGRFPAKYRIGASAEIKRKDQKEFITYDVFGEIGAEIDKHTLIRKGRIHEVTIRIIPTKYELALQTDYGEEINWQDLPKENMEENYRILYENISKDEYRNDYIWKFIEPCLKHKKICVIVTNRVEHAKYWDKRLTKTGYKSGLLIGGKDYAEEFDTTVRGLQNKNIQIGVGTIQKFSTGHDITTLERGFIISPLATNTPIMNQFAGRLRRTDPNKKDVVLYYFLDELIFSYHQKLITKAFPKICQKLKGNYFVKL